MKPCSRMWQVEALEDGRLADADAASFARHVSGCDECSTEQAAARALRERMMALDAPRQSELTRRSQRAELLKRAHQQSSATSPKRLWAVGAVAACAAGVALAVAWPTPTPNRFEVVDVAQANWKVVTEGSTSRVTLDAGTALFQVQRLRPDARFVVRLPDGEIEVRGTRFVVDVAGGRTRSVVVTEGTVALRIGGAEVALHAGDRWPEGATAAGSTASIGTWVAPPPSPATSGSVAPSAVGSGQQSVAARERNEPPVPQPVAPSPTEKPTAGAPTASVAVAIASTAAADASAVAPVAPSPSARFADAMAAFSAGDYGRADGLFAKFVSDFPRDGRTEDASYLRIECRARVGDRAGAATLARQYLQIFPRGLRRPEAERFAGSQ